MDATLPILLDKARGAGWQIVVRGTDQGRMMWLDEKLWSQGPESFLAHGVSGGPHDALQPILLTTDVAVPNAATCIMSVDGAVVSAQEVKDAERVCIHCGNTARCRRWLNRGAADDAPRLFCPNAELFDEMGRSWRN